MKKKLLLLLALIIQSDILFANENEDVTDDDEDLLLQSPLLRNISESEDIYAQHEELRQRFFYTKKDALKLLTRACNPDVPPSDIATADNILRDDLYLRTNPINQRSLLDLPQFLFLPFCWGECNWQFYWHYFYNQTTEAYYTQDGKTIDSYLAFNNPKLIQSLQALAFNINVPQVFTLLSDMTIQERRTGVMFEWLWRRGNWYLEGKTPLEYLERNFFLEEEKKRQLEAELLLDEESVNEADDFGHEHLASDKLGIGDTRLYAGYNLYESPSLLLNGGFLATVPTAFAFIKGLTGSYFPKNNKIPPFDLIQILNLTISPDPGDDELLRQIATNFLIGAVDKLSANLLETGLGNNGHLGLGLFIDNELWVSQKLRFKTHAELEYLLPAPEKRFYINRKNQAEFDEILNLISGDPTPEECNVAFDFLQEQIINTLFPRVYETIIYPGFLFKVTSALTGSMGQNYTLMLGIDSWLQQKEKIGWLIASRQEREMARQDIATKSGAYQLKLFGAVNYMRQTPVHDWCLSFWADGTVLSTGIGKDFNLGARFELAW
jgi:hypothetical protein